MKEKHTSHARRRIGDVRECHRNLHRFAIPHVSSIAIEPSARSSGTQTRSRSKSRSLNESTSACLRDTGSAWMGTLILSKSCLFIIIRSLTPFRYTHSSQITIIIMDETFLSTLQAAPPLLEACKGVGALKQLRGLCNTARRLATASVTTATIHLDDPAQQVDLLHMLHACKLNHLVLVARDACRGSHRGYPYQTTVSKGALPQHKCHINVMLETESYKIHMSLSDWSY